MHTREQASKALDIKELTRQLLTDVLNEPVDYNPRIIATSTKSTDVFASKSKGTRKDLANINPKLSHIIPCPNLVRQLVPELNQALKNIWVQPRDRLSMRVDSKYTKVPLTRAIHSEKDSEDVFLGLYLYPALSLISFLKAKEKLEKEDPSKNFTNDEIMDYAELGDKEFRLYAASFSGAAHIADLGVWELLSNDEESLLHLVTEVKTPKVFPEALLSQVSPRISQEIDMKKTEGWAIQFNWPGPNKNFGHQDSMKHNKVISQVWNQMVYHNKRFAILTCNNIHYCFYRKDLESGHLYISPPCHPHKDGLVDIEIWILKAAGYLKGDINVPIVLSDWWKNVRKSREPGINGWTLPHDALSYYNKKQQSRRLGAI